MFGPAKTDNTIVMSFGSPLEEILFDKQEELSAKKENFFVEPSKFIVSNPENEGDNRKLHIKLHSSINYDEFKGLMNDGSTLIGINKIREGKPPESYYFKVSKEVYGGDRTVFSDGTVVFHNGGRSSEDGKEIITGDTVEGDDTPQLPDDKDKDKDSRAHELIAQMAEVRGLTVEQFLGTGNFSSSTLQRMAKYNDDIAKERMKERIEEYSGEYSKNVRSRYEVTTHKYPTSE